ncbi:MAG: hypothetical protein JW731_14355 [Bacteroidales bacterium]|nr:hypothetical protein [Bacteroidales bacterium]
MTAINNSLLSRGEQLAVARLVAKEMTGKELSAKERRFISDMRSRGMGRLRFRNRNAKQKSFQTK